MFGDILREVVRGTAQTVTELALEVVRLPETVAAGIDDAFDEAES